MDVSGFNWVVETLTLLGKSQPKSSEGKGIKFEDKSSSKMVVEEDWELETQIAQQAISNFKLSKFQTSLNIAVCILCDQGRDASKLVSCDSCQGAIHKECVELEPIG